MEEMNKRNGIDDKEMEFYKLCQSAKEDITGVDIKNLARQYGVEL